MPRPVDTLTHWGYAETLGEVCSIEHKRYWFDLMRHTGCFMKQLDSLRGSVGMCAPLAEVQSAKLLEYQSVVLVKLCLLC